MKLKIIQKIFDKFRRKAKFNICGNEIPLIRSNSDEVIPFTIGITTYDKRFEKYFMPLLKKIREVYQGDIIVTINNNYKMEFNQEYRREMLKFLSEFDNVYPIFFTEFRSLSKMWNNIIMNSKTDKVLLLNDDLIIDDNIFWNDLKSAIIQSNGKSFKINQSWSHVLLNKMEVIKLNWFDERYLGIGREDFDYERRFFAMNKKNFISISNVKGIVNDSSFEECVLNQKFAMGKYSQFNEDVYFKKFSKSGKFKRYKQYESELFYLQHKDEL